MDILNIDQWPCVVVAVANGFEPCGFGGETCGSMQVSDGLLDTWKFINIVDVFWFMFSCCFEVISNLLGRWYFTQFVERLLASFGI